jgi:hypothetical protein
MRALIDEAMGNGPYNRRQLAGEIVDKLRVNDPELLFGWLDLQAATLLYETIRSISRSQRSYTTRNHHRRLFGEAADEFEAEQRGETTGKNSRAKIQDFLAVRYVRPDGKEERFGKLTGPDVHCLADGYERREKENAFWKVLMRVIAKKIGDDAVEDHYDNEQLTVMFSGMG